MMIVKRYDRNEYEKHIRKAVRIKLIESVNEMKTLSGSEPWFVHNHFELSRPEDNIDFSGLEVAVCYASASLFLHVAILNKDSKEAVSSPIAQQICQRIKSQLKSHPSITDRSLEQLQFFVERRKGFQSLLEGQTDFQPLGEMVAEFTFDNDKRSAQMYKAERTSRKTMRESDKMTNEKLRTYLARAQSMAFWFIKELNYTDEYERNSDGRGFFHYFVYELKSHGCPFKFLGYATLFRPDNSGDSARISHFMLAPQYTHNGLGSEVLNAIYGDLLKDDSIKQIKIEKPAKQFKFVRDFTDCGNLLKMSEFSGTKVMATNTITEDMTEAAKKLKLEMSQYKRAFEIIRLFFYGEERNVPKNLLSKYSENEWSHCWRVVERLKKYVRTPPSSPEKQLPKPVQEEAQISLTERSSASVPKMAKLNKCTRRISITKHKDHFQRQTRSHTGGKPYKCHQCPYVSRGMSDLKRHTRIHTDEKPFKCNQCSYSNAQSSNLKLHIRIHTGEKPFKCNQCSFASSSISDWKRHMRTHTGEKPYKCNLCSYSSAQSSNLKVHMRIHTDEKTFKCNQCSFISSCISDLNRHTRTHTDEKPFKCNQCSYSSGQSSNLKLHMRIHTALMNPHTMLSQFSIISGGKCTFAALVRFLASVNAHVTLKGGCIIADVGTQSTLVWFLASVNAHVPFHMIAVDARIITQSAFD
ncbi:c2H2-type zinc-finger domain-containing protein [Ditylenchus destructor]|uniref:Histone acetyltransferase type B catalytic subunit n=1 Tax=Ditylenchus destructor TaxID=166010 RepID=A0AAD4QX14_9BILA|nr:c2H2-type zinc-finger domain-containing protein [Ditylenchus destructor]